MTDARTVLLDAAHNPAGARALRRLPRDVGSERRCRSSSASMRDKDVDGMLRGARADRARRRRRPRPLARAAGARTLAADVAAALAGARVAVAAGPESRSRARCARAPRVAAAVLRAGSSRGLVRRLHRADRPAAVLFFDDCYVCRAPARRGTSRQCMRFMFHALLLLARARRLARRRPPAPRADRPRRLQASKQQHARAASIADDTGELIGTDGSQ